MSDHYIELIPQDPAYVPMQDAISKSLRLLDEIVPEAGNITADVSQGIKFRDCGGNFESVSCPKCGTLLSTDWWSDRMSDDYDGEGFLLSPLALPCGHSVSSLNDLKYQIEQGFSKFVLRAANPNIGVLNPPQIASLEKCLGCKLRIIYRHI